MKNLKPLLPIIAIFYILVNLYYSVIQSIINENSFLRHIIRDLSNGSFRNLNVHFFRTLVSWVLIGVLIKGAIDYYNSPDRKINKLLEFGLIYNAVSTLLSLPVSISYMTGMGSGIGSGPGIMWYIQYPIFVISAIIISIYFSRQIKTFQRPPFGHREKSYGSTPYQQYLDSGKLSVTRGTRFKNYLLDGIFVYLLGFSAVTQFITTYFGHSMFSYNNSIGLNLVILLALFSYYLLMESIFGKTLGKIITGTAVQFYGKSSFGGALGRAFCRLIPFEPFSYLFKNGYGWHDEFSKTTVEKLESTMDIKDDLNDLAKHLIEN